jgi:hypothetical protein
MPVIKTYCWVLRILMPFNIGRNLRCLGYACSSHVKVARSGEAEMYLWPEWQRKAKCIPTCTVNCLAYNQLCPQSVVWNLQSFPRDLTVAKIKYYVSRNRLKIFTCNNQPLQNLMQLFHCKPGRFSSGDTEDYSHKMWKCLYQLNFWSLAITLRTTRYNIPKYYFEVCHPRCV